MCGQEEALETLRSSVSSADYDNKIRELEKRQKSAEMEANRISEELKRIHMQADQRAKLSLKTSDLARKKASLDET
jgi:Cdc6-like AAA superfamily ATPase